MKSMARFGGILGVICLIATALLAGTNAATSGKIRMQEDRELKDSLKEVMPEAAGFEPVMAGGDISYYKATDTEGKLLGAAFKASAKGYSSTIQTIAGMKPDGTLTAIKIISQQETPGLGSRIAESSSSVSIIDFLRGRRRAFERPWFQAQFDNKRSRELDSVKAITGATISSKAVIDSVKLKASQIYTELTNGR